MGRNFSVFSRNFGDLASESLGRFTSNKNGTMIPKDPFHTKYGNEGVPP